MRDDKKRNWFEIKRRRSEAKFEGVNEDGIIERACRAV